MSEIASHYAAGGPVEKVNAVLETIAPGGGSVTLEQLSGFDHFHTAGQMATVRMGDLLNPARADTVLDAGSGIGGPARYLASRFGCKVIGVDLTPDFTQIARMISERTGLTDRTEFDTGDITALDLPDASVDHAWTQHVAMNIADRAGLYREIRRVLKPGGRFAAFDVVDAGGGELVLPVPWATKPEHSHLLTSDAMRDAIEGAGFTIETWDDPTAEMVEATKALLATAPDGAPPLLSPALIIDDVATKGPNYMRNIAEGRTALRLAVAVAV